MPPTTAAITPGRPATGWACASWPSTRLLDAATQGFVDALKEELGDDVNIEVQNASGESNNCSTIINGFLSSDVDLIMANATPALTAAASATSEGAHSGHGRYGLRRGAGPWRL